MFSFLNSMWGRWSLRNNLTRTLITSKPENLHAVLNNRTLVIGAIQMLNDDLFMVDYQKKNDFVTPHSKYNVVLSLFTTSAARVCLYNYMDRVANTPNCKLLYTGEW